MKSNKLFKCGTKRALFARILNFDEDPNFDNITEFEVKEKKGRSMAQRESGVFGDLFGSNEELGFKGIITD